MGFKGWSGSDVDVSRVPGKVIAGFDGRKHDLGIGHDLGKVKDVDKRSVRNYRRVELDGLLFDSKVEGMCYQSLRAYGFDFEVKRKYVLLEAFEFNGKRVLGWEYEPDFGLELHGIRIIVEVKGYADARFPYKLKMLKRLFASDAGNSYRILFVHLQRQVPHFFSVLDAFARTGDMSHLDCLQRDFGHHDSDSVKTRRNRKARESRKARVIRDGQPR